MIAEERANILTNFLMEDVERAKKLTSLPAEEAVVEINNHCACDFTLDELVAYSQAQNSSELNSDELGQVAGGATGGGPVDPVGPIDAGGQIYVWYYGVIVVVGASAILPVADPIAYNTTSND